MSFKNITLETSGNIGILTVNRPKVLNALSIDTVIELGNAIKEVKENEEIKALIITGAGEKAFVAGADISELQPLNSEEAEEYALRGQLVFSMIEGLAIPVIAAVNGFALGGGCELAMACHIRIASEKAKFGQPEVKLGVIPGYGGTQRLPRIVGKGIGMQLCLTGEIINAQRAYEIGLVNKLSAPEKLMDDAKAMAEEIISGGPCALALVIQAVNEGLETTLENGLQIEAELFGSCASTEDWKEGTQAFVEKRKADFKGK